MMARHDQIHAGEIADLLERLAGRSAGASRELIAALRAHATADLPGSPEAPSSRPAAA